MNNRLNVLLIVIDTLRADHLSCYGYPVLTSPRIDGLGKKGILYSGCFSHAPWTIPSFTSILTGLDPILHRVVASPWNVPDHPWLGLSDRILTWAEMLREAGYVTVAIDNLLEMASHPNWFARGFKQYINLTDRLYLRHHHILAEQVTDSFLKWSPQNQEAPWFAFLHYWDPHLPYNYPKKYKRIIDVSFPESIKTASGKDYIPCVGYADSFKEKYKNLVIHYDRSVRYVDTQIGRIIDELEKLGLMQNTLIIITSDHGECMTEHNVLFNHSLLYDPTIHVPLIIYGPHLEQKGIVCEQIVQHIDLLPTVLYLLRIDTYKGMQGNILPFSKEAPFDRTFAVSCQDGGAAIRSLRTREWKFICHYDLTQAPDSTHPHIKSMELYDLIHDPFELQNVSNEHPDITQGIFEALENWRQDLLNSSKMTDPLLDSQRHVDFERFPGDPELVTFYKELKKERL